MQTPSLPACACGRPSRRAQCSAADTTAGSRQLCRNSAAEYAKYAFSYPLSEEVPTKQLIKGSRLALYSSIITNLTNSTLQPFTDPLAHFRLINLYPEASTMSGANQSYPQTVNLDTAKAKAAQLQSETSKAQGGNINPTDPASKARVRHLTLLYKLCRMRTAMTISPSWHDPWHLHCVDGHKFLFCFCASPFAHCLLYLR